MFSAYCPRHDAVVLYSSSNIVELRNTPLGVEMTVECYDGERFEVLSGQTAEPALV